jgi:hypothetical protein
MPFDDQNLSIALGMEPLFAFQADGLPQFAETLRAVSARDAIVRAMATLRRQLAEARSGRLLDREIPIAQGRAAVAAIELIERQRAAVDELAKSIERREVALKPPHKGYESMGDGELTTALVADLELCDRAHKVGLDRIVMGIQAADPAMVRLGVAISRAGTLAGFEWKHANEVTAALFEAANRAALADLRAVKAAHSGLVQTIADALRQIDNAAGQAIEIATGKRREAPAMSIAAEGAAVA